MADDHHEVTLGPISACDQPGCPCALGTHMGQLMGHGDVDPEHSWEGGKQVWTWVLGRTRAGTGPLKSTIRMATPQTYPCWKIRYGTGVAGSLGGGNPWGSQASNGQRYWAGALQGNAGAKITGDVPAPGESLPTSCESQLGRVFLTATEKYDGGKHCHIGFCLVTGLFSCEW